MTFGVATALWIAAEFASPGARYDGHVVAKVEVHSQADVQTLIDAGVDMWTERPGPGIVLVRIPPQVWPSVAASGLAVEVTTPDLGPVVDAEFARVGGDPVADHTGAYFDDYRELDEIYDHLDALADLRPDIATVLEFGASLEGRPMRAVEITAPDPDAPVVLLNAGQHAREWISPTTAVCIIDELITRADEPEIASLLSQVTFVIAPVINPDGYTYTWTDERFWRKNRRGEFGVDTNRNFSVAWGGPGSSNNPEAGNYRGESEFSEPETAALRDLAQSYDNVRSHVDIHSFGQLVLYPWGWVDEPAPADETLAPLAEQMAQVFTDVHGEEYVPLMGAQFYPASGNCTDWFYGELGAYSFTYELRPNEAEPHNEGFDLPPGQIRGVCRETMAAITTLAEFTISAEPGVPGDDGNAETDGWASTGAVETGDGGTGVDPSDPTTSGAESNGSVGGATTNTPPGSTTAPPPGGGTTTGDASEPNAAEDSDGCGCRSSQPAAWWMLALLGLAGWTRPRGRVRPSPRR